MTSIGSINLKVAILDSDYYALQAINSYLAWDRRTRVMFSTTSRDRLLDYLRSTIIAELPDVIVMDVDHLGTPDEVKKFFGTILSIVPQALLIGMAQFVDAGLIEAVVESGGRAFLLKGEVGMQIAWAIVYAQSHDFLITLSIAKIAHNSHQKRLYEANILPDQREYPEMTDRIRQAIRLCVIEGMPAHLAADEMGISLHTIRGYIKEGYRILESYDQQEYPTDMTPQERAFMRFTALAMDDKDD